MVEGAEGGAGEAGGTAEAGGQCHFRETEKAEDELARQASELSALNIQLKAEVKELEGELGRMKTGRGPSLRWRGRARLV